MAADGLRAGAWQQRVWLACNASASAALLWAAWRLAKAQAQRQEAHGQGAPGAGARPGGGAPRSGAAPAELPSPELTLSLLKARRSIFPKDYNGRGKAASDEDLRLLLEAANWAPTHKRNEPWRFVVFRGREAIDQVCQATIEGNRAATDAERGGQTFDEWFADFQDNGIGKKWSRCDTLISLSMLREAQPGKRLPEWEEVGAVSCAVQNMHLMATSLGLAGYWSSWNIAGRDSRAMAALLGLSAEDGDRCLGFFALGSSDKVGKIKCGRGAVAEKTRWVQ